MKNTGICFAGNIIADRVNEIDCFPSVGMLANIGNSSRSVGGCVCNTAIDLAKIDPDIPISAIGKVGKDDSGAYVINEMSKFGIDCSNISLSNSLPTSFSEVMSLRSGERTFFHARGANAEFCPEDIELSKLQCDILHIGYILLLDKFDAYDEEYGTVMARFLHDAGAAGIKTSVDIVSDSNADYPAKIVPALKYCDFLIVNELEICSAWKLSPYKDTGELDKSNIRAAMELSAKAGVKEKIVVHCKEAGFCLDVKSSNFSEVPSLDIPKSEIKGSVGAGDAFCAGSLYGIYNGFSDTELLGFASAAAACCLFAENSVDGMRSREETEKINKLYKRRSV